MSDLPYTHGLGWDESGLVPVFTVEPDVTVIEKIIQKHFHLNQSTSTETAIIRITLIEGFVQWYTKVYKIEIMIGEKVQSYCMRVAIPLDMPFRVESEVATTLFIRKHTDAPVPTVLAYDSTNDNDLRFPWMLMEWMPGRPMDQFGWRSKSNTLDRKIELTKRLADIQSQLLQHEHQAIGSWRHSVTKTHTISPSIQTNHQASFFRVMLIVLICVSNPLPAAVCLSLILVFSRFSSQPYKEPVHEDNNISFGKIVSNDFTLCRKGTSRGPFFNVADWITARLRDVQAEYVRDMLFYEKEESLKSTEDMLSFTTRLLKLIPRLFPVPCDRPESSFLLLELDRGNVLVDHNGQLSGLVGFEYVFTTSLWNFCQTPRIIDPHRMRIQEPPKDPERYPPDADCWTVKTDDIKDSGVCSAYFDDLADYERTILQDVYHSEMERTRPGWKDMYHETKPKREFLSLMESAEIGWVGCDYKFKWLKRMEQGKSTERIFDRPLFDNDGKVEEEKEPSSDDSDSESGDEDQEQETHEDEDASESEDGSGSEDEAAYDSDATRVDSGEEEDEESSSDDADDDLDLTGDSNNLSTVIPEAIDIILEGNGNNTELSLI